MACLQVVYPLDGLAGRDRRRGSAAYLNISPIRIPVCLLGCLIHASQRHATSRALRLICHCLDRSQKDSSLHEPFTTTTTADPTALQQASARPPAPPQAPALPPSCQANSSGATPIVNNPFSSSRPFRNRLRKSHSAHRDSDFSRADALWFFSLPDKVRRTHFSREEQVLLAGRGDTFFFDFADPERSAPSRRDQEKQKKSNVNRPLNGEGDLEKSPFAPTVPPSERPRSESLSHDSVLQLDPDKAADSEIIHLDAMPSPPDDSQARRPRRSSVRRTLSITTNPFGRSSTSSAPVTSPLFSPSYGHWRPRASTSAGTPNMDSSALSPVEPGPRHYQDPEARMKLRCFLASPQKFDEAIEFGFPSTTRTTAPVATPRPGDAAKVSRDVQTFLRDDAVSLLGSHTDDAASALAGSDDEGNDAISPVTPTSSTENVHFITRLVDSKFSSIDSSGLPSLALRDYTQDPVFQAPIAGREMTLRMTLTRPELRAKEEELYGWQPNAMFAKDPLALEELPPPSDDVTGAHGAFAVQTRANKGIMGRLFNRGRKCKV